MKHPYLPNNNVFFLLSHVLAKYLCKEVFARISLECVWGPNLQQTYGQPSSHRLSPIGSGNFAMRFSCAFFEFETIVSLGFDYNSLFTEAL